MEGKARKLSQLAELVQGEVLGDPKVTICGVADLASAGPDEITFVTDVKKCEQISTTKAAAVVVPQQVDEADKPIIRVRDPYLAITLIHNYFIEKTFVAGGVSPNALIGEDCRIPAEVSIAPLVVLGDRVTVGERVTLHPGVVIGDDVTIGDDTVLYANVTVYAKSLIGCRVIVHSGAVIGSDGYGYVADEHGHHVKRPHVGIVQIDDDVEIGANVCIDRATFGRTWVQRGAKIDNLVQLGHNVVIGEDSLLVSQVGIAGSTRLGNGVVLGGQVGIGGHLQLGDRVMVAAKSGVHNNQESGKLVSGIPAISHKKWLRASTAFARLPELVKDVRELKKKLTQIWQKLYPNDASE